MTTVDNNVRTEDGERIVINISPAFTPTGLIQVTNYGRCRLTLSADTSSMDRNPGKYITDDIVMAIRAVANNHRTMKASVMNVVIHSILDAYDQTVVLDYLRETVEQDNDTLSKITAARKQVAQTSLHDATASADLYRVNNAKDFAVDALDDYIDIVSRITAGNLVRIEQLNAALQ